MASVSKADYLKRYLSGSEAADGRKKKKKKTQGAGVNKLRIVDDDIDLAAVAPSVEEADAKEAELLDDAPTIVDIIDDRPAHIKQMEAYNSGSRWKKIQQETSPEQKVRKRHDSDSDASPCRKNRHDSDSDASPPRKTRHDSDSDASPPRKKRHDSDSDASPPRRKKQNSASPPKRRKSANLRNNRHGSDSDVSPPRKKRHDSDSDASPPRKKRHNSDSDASPPRKKRHGSDSDASPARRKGSDSKKRDSSKGRNRDSSATRHADRDSGKTKKSRWADSEETDSSKMKKTLAGAKAGLSSAKDMRDEIRKLKAKEDEAFSKIDASVLGKDAATVVRGRKKTKQQEEEEAAAAEQHKQKMEQYNKWGKGLAQQEEQKQKLDEALHEVSKPLARYRDDEDLDAMLKAQDREGDPMLAFIKKKKIKDARKEKPVYKGPEPPPNRFNIRPGFRWDGVDRSNGFEKQFFNKISDRKAVQEQAYKWSVEDM